MGEVIDLLPLVRQRLAEDMLPAGHKYWDELKLTRPSDDVLDLAHEESSKRMNMVAPMQNMLDVYAFLTADICSQVMLKNLKSSDHNFDADTINRWYEAKIRENREIVRGCIYPILAHLIDAGTIAYGPEVFSGMM